MIHLLTEKATSKQMSQMLESLGLYIKLAVDIEKKTVAGGGVLDADCEAVLLENESRQENIWGADWIPQSQEVTFESLIRIRPRQNNFSMEVESEELRKSIEKIVREFFEDVDYE
jgi:Protein of unknown function (DUF5674)